MDEKQMRKFIENIVKDVGDDKIRKISLNWISFGRDDLCIKPVLEMEFNTLMLLDKKQFKVFSSICTHREEIIKPPLSYPGTDDMYRCMHKSRLNKRCMNAESCVMLGLIFNQK